MKTKCIKILENVPEEISSKKNVTKFKPEAVVAFTRPSMQVFGKWVFRKLQFATSTVSLIYIQGCNGPRSPKWRQWI